MDLLMKSVTPQMPDLWNQLFDSNGFMPHGHCYLWNPDLVRLHLTTDLAIGLSYIAISLTLVYFVLRARQDVPFSWIFGCFGVFILACAGTHFMEVWTLWNPVYWLSGAVKFVTAAASVVTAVVLPPLLPKALVLIRAAKLSEQGQLDLESANQALQHEILERERREKEIHELNLELEQRVAARTAELVEANQSLKQMAAIVEYSNDAIVSLNLEGCITSWNPAAERLYGRRADDILGCPIAVLAPAGLPDEMSTLVERVKRGEDIHSFETAGVRKSGKQFSMHITLSTIKNESGEIQGTSLIARDVPERRRTEEMLRLTVEATPNAMVMTDDQGKIVLVNSQTEKLFGYLREELLGEIVEILVPHKYRDKHPAQRAAFMRAPGIRAIGTGRDLYGLRKDGSEFPVEIGLNPIETDQGTCVLSVIVDVTGRKRSEEEIKRLNQDLEQRVEQRTRELTAANAELEAFSYTVSHDLRGPLRQIAGFANILAEEHASELSPEYRRYLQKVQDGAQQMGVLIDDLLNLARVGRQPVSRRLTPLNGLVNAALEQLNAQDLHREIEWNIEDLGSVACDPALISLVFVNLLSNSIKYTRPRDRALIHVGRTMIDQETIFFIRDNGAGFDMEYSGKLFGVFQRLHKASDFEGTGVGLATVQRIIHKHGGRVWADAKVDKGATFLFTIPPGEDSMNQHDSEIRRGKE
jgi:PAS domain S-box-containing protein